MNTIDTPNEPTSPRNALNPHSQKEKERLQAELKQELVRVKRINAAKLK